MNNPTSMSPADLEKITDALSEATRPSCAAIRANRIDARPCTRFMAARIFSKPIRRSGSAHVALAFARGICARCGQPRRALGIGRRSAIRRNIIYDRIVEKLRREPVEDFRLDFEDGYGNRPDAEEDGHAAAAARGSRARTRRRNAAAVYRHPDQTAQRRFARPQRAHARYFHHSPDERPNGKLPAKFRHHRPEDSAARTSHGGGANLRTARKKTA